MLHLNIRSIPDHFLQLTSLLNNLNIELEIVAISKTCIKSFHINYNIPNYKVFERVMYNHITDFIDSLNVLSKYQFGFRHKHYFQQAIITLVNKIMSSLDTGDLVIGVFLDLKNAFDTVDHKILLDKMHAYGIRGNILRWFRSYLTHRSIDLFFFRKIFLLEIVKTIYRK